jgi:heme-degrading monooxygenase HmoA
MMYFVSVTRLRLKRARTLPAFLWLTLRSMLQARKSKGNMDVQTLKDRGLVFWTMTVWGTEEDMRAFRNSGEHKRVMPRLSRWCDEASHVHWAQDRPAAPSWTAAWERLVKEGVSTRLEEPSPDHLARRIRRPHVH